MVFALFIYLFFYVNNDTIQVAVYIDSECLFLVYQVNRLYNFLARRPTSRSSLLSLLDDSSLSNLIKTSSLPSNEKLPSNSRRFYHHNSMFLTQDGQVKVIKFEFRGLRDDDHDGDLLKYSKLLDNEDVFEEYRWEKGSIIWKIKSEELDKRNSNSEKEYIGKLKSNIDEQISRFKELMREIRDKLNDEMSSIGELERDLMDSVKSLIHQITKIKRAASYLYQGNIDDNLMRRFNHWESVIKGSVNQMTGSKKL